MTASQSEQDLDGGNPPAATPLALELARALKIDLATIRPAAAGGPITELDVREAAASLANAARTLEPAETLALEPRVDTTPAAARLRTIRRTTPWPVSLDASGHPGEPEPIDLLLHSLSAGLQRHRRLNAHLVGRELRLFAEVHVGVSVVVGDALVLPVIRDAGESSASELAAQRRRLSAAASVDELQPWQLDGATFTVFDLGDLGADSFEPRPISPQVAALGIGRVSERPVVVSGTLTARPEAWLSLTYDARAAGDVSAARLLAGLVGDLSAGAGDEPRRGSDDARNGPGPD